MLKPILILLSAAVLGAAAEKLPLGERVDLAEFGRIKGWPADDEERAFPRRVAGAWTAVAETASRDRSNLGVEWDEARDFTEIRARFRTPVRPEEVQPEYWLSSWPPEEGRGGWTLTDSPWKGEWRPIRAAGQVEGGVLVFRFEPLTATENPNAARRPGWAPQFRRALKVRLRFSRTPPVIASFHVYGTSRWSARTVFLESGCEGKTRAAITAEVYNGRLIQSRSEARRIRLTVLHTEHEPESADRTILTVRAGEFQFGVALDDLIREKAMYVRDAGVFVSDAAVGESFASYLASGRMRLGIDIMNRVSREAEQSLARATAEIPALRMTNRRPYRYVPLGFFGNREKYALAFNGNFFVSKRGSKLFAEEVAQMLWDGDTIWYRVGAGAVPDFRERENAARQSVVDGYQPVVITEWDHEGVQYREEAFATLLDARLDPVGNRGDEPSAMLVKVTATNPGEAPLHAALWFHVQPEENLAFRDGLLETAASPRRFRAFVGASSGAAVLADLPRGSDYRGQAVRWQHDIPPGDSATVHFRITFRTMTDPEVMRRVAALDYASERERVVSYWRAAVDSGMRLHVPDEPLNRFFQSALQHILLSVQRDVPTGLYMAPCGTYSYNMFANETDMQVRLLDMRGLHDLAAKFVEPFVVLQGSKPFPGRFRRTDAIFHGVRVDPDHDYTHSGYNLNHGWTLWTLAEHYLYTRDREWLRARLPNILKAADWIISERKATMRADGDGRRVWEYGLLPAGQLEDNEELLYWYAVNGYAYRGLRVAGQAVAGLDPAQGERLATEAQRYRDDIRAAVKRSLAAAPVTPLRDGTWVPAVPPRTALHGRDVGWIRNILYGAHALVDCGVLDPDEQITTWILQDLEDNLFMAPWSFSVPEQDWFSRGGITLQPNLVNTAITYLRRDQIAQALRPFYNTFAASYYPDGNAFTEWLPSFGTSGGPFFKTSDEACFLTWLRLFLLREEGDRLHLASGAPRRWFRSGERIEAGDAATFFGEVSFRIASRAEDGYIDANVELPAGFRAREILMRIRHPDGKPISRVERNGSLWERFEPANETILLPTVPGTTKIRVYF